MGKLTISMAIFNSYVKLPEGRSLESWNLHEPSHALKAMPIFCRHLIAVALDG